MTRRRPLHVESAPSERIDLGGVPRGTWSPGPDLRGRRAPYPRTRPLELPPTPTRLARGGCRTRVDGVRCSHPERAHRAVGFEGWRSRCDGCGCSGYRDPWERAAASLACVVLLVVVLLYAVARYGPLVLPALAPLLEGPPP